jgi:hypothetical protein
MLLAVAAVFTFAQEAGAATEPAAQEPVALAEFQTGLRIRIVMDKSIHGKPIRPLLVMISLLSTSTT